MVKKILTVGELYNDLKSQLELMPSMKDNRIVVYISSGGFPATPSVDIGCGGFGIDFDSGKYILHPNEPLIKKEKRKKIQK